MSAFIVSRKHIQYLVQAALDLPGRTVQGGRLYWYNKGPHQLPYGDSEMENRVGQILWDENIKSVLYRYPGDTKETAPGPIGESYEYTHTYFPPKHIDPVQTLKACACLDYQSCEHPEWEASEAHAILEAIRNAAIAALPGYEDANWEID